MIKPIVKDTFFLSQKSEPTTEKDTEVIKDLQDTLLANREGCLSLLGTRKTTRYKDIEVEYEDINFKKQR